jgi:hypothetical protein
MPIDMRKIDPELKYSLKDVAIHLELSYGTILKLKKEKKLRYFKLGKQYFVQGKDIISYVEKGRST